MWHLDYNNEILRDYLPPSDWCIGLALSAKVNSSKD
jgi:hypothetical protein